MNKMSGVSSIKFETSNLASEIESTLFILHPSCLSYRPQNSIYSLANCG
jgi:hypothetical protein